MSALSRLALAGFALAAVPALALGLKVDVNKGLWTHTRGGFYHDGRFATLRCCRTLRRPLRSRPGCAGES